MNFLPDQLVQDLAALWNETRPANIPAEWSIYDFTRTDARELPCVVIGHEGMEREKAPEMSGTGKVRLRVVVMTDKDVTPDPDHRAVVSACDVAVRAIKGELPGEQPLPLVYLHDLLQENPANSMVEHRQLTVMPWTVVGTLMEET